ncbi:MAG: DUF3592 domain-containing protein [Gammaproteobacteria bacterium]|nr:DUF3592 domain-containing protein [Gammaproteobacteria bacterium]
MTQKGKHFIISLGLFFILAGGFLLYLNLKVIYYGETLTGTVIGYEERSQNVRGTSGSTDAPLVRFRYDGQVFQIPAQMSSAWHDFKPGDHVTIYFDPSNHSEVILDTLYHKYGFGGLILLCGIYLLFMPKLEQWGSQ